MELKYKAPLSTFSIIFTIASNMGVLLIVYIMLFRNDLLKHTNQPPDSIKYFMIFFILFIFGSAFLLHPRQYILTSKNLIIDRILFKRSIVLSSVLDVKIISYEELGVRIRLLGSGGIWGYFGFFNSSYYGILRMNTSNLNNLIFIATSNKKIYIISPDNPEQFLQTIQKKINNETP